MALQEELFYQHGVQPTLACSVPQSFFSKTAKMVARLLLTRRLQHTAAVTQPSYVVHIPNANVYRFGDPDGARPVLRAVDWAVHEGESWAVVGSGAGEKTALLEVSQNNPRRRIQY